LSLVVTFNGFIVFIKLDLLFWWYRYLHLAWAYFLTSTVFFNVSSLLLKGLYLCIFIISSKKLPIFHESSRICNIYFLCNFVVVGWNNIHAPFYLFSLLNNGNYCILLLLCRVVFLFFLKNYLYVLVLLQVVLYHLLFCFVFVFVGWRHYHHHCSTFLFYFYGYRNNVYFHCYNLLK
jgi:hypothetical protein